MQKILTPSLIFLLLLAAAVPVFATWDEGVSAFRAGRFEDAATAFRSVVDGSPSAPQGHYMLGLTLMRLGDSAAGAHLAKAVELQPESADFRMALAQSQLVAGRAGQALSTLAASDLGKVEDAKRSSLAALLAKAAIQGDRNAEASRALADALEVLPGSKPLWTARATVEKRLGNPRESFQALSAAFDLDRADTALGQQVVLAAFTLAAQDESGARGWYSRGATVAASLADREPTPQNLRYAGVSRMNLQDYGEALAWFERAATAEPGNAEHYYHQARCLLAMDEVGAERAQQALGLLDTALERSPAPDLTGDVWSARGSALRHLERFADAADAYRRAGDAAKVAEMEEFLERQHNNKEWEKQKRLCLEKQEAVRAHLAANDDLEGTELWRKFEKDAENELRDCQPYLNGEG